MTSLVCHPRMCEQRAWRVIRGTLLNQREAPVSIESLTETELSEAWNLLLKELAEVGRDPVRCIAEKLSLSVSKEMTEMEAAELDEIVTRKYGSDPESAMLMQEGVLL